MSGARHFPILIVGAGPSGLATAYYLQRLRLDFLMLEQEGPGASWAHYYDDLRLHTRKPNVALPGLLLAAELPDFVTGKQYAAYLRSYVEQFDFPMHVGVRVARARPANGGWRLETTAGEFTAEHLIVASGIFGNPKRPPLPDRETFGGQILDAAAFKSAAPFHGRSVLVVGAGNTGVGVALSLVQAGAQVGLAVRDGVQLAPLPRNATATRWKAKVLKWLPDALANALLKGVRRSFGNLGLPAPTKPPLSVTPVLGFDLVTALREGRVQVHPGLERLSPDGVHFEDGSLQNYSALILATGYAPVVDFLPESLSLSQTGRVENPTPGLHTVGFHYPTTSPFLLNMRTEAKQLAEGLAKNLRVNSK